MPQAANKGYRLVHIGNCEGGIHKGIMSLRRLAHFSRSVRLSVAQQIDTPSIEPLQGQHVQPRLILRRVVDGIGRTIGCTVYEKHGFIRLRRAIARQTFIAQQQLVVAAMAGNSVVGLFDHKLLRASARRLLPARLYTNC